MKKLILFLVFFPTFLFSQSQLDFFGSADLTGCNYGWNSFTGNVRNSKDATFNTHFGVNYAQSIREKIWLKIGLGFSSTGYHQGTGELRYGSQHDGQGGFNPILPAESFTLKYNHHFLEVPIALRIDFSTKKLKPFIEFGISTMYYLQTVSIFKIGDNPKSIDKNRANDINQIQIAPTLAFGCSYDLSDKWAVFVQPNVRYHISKMGKNTSANEHQWSAGLALGMRMNLK